MNLERALEAQRVKLLRLLTGWFAVVALLSGGPFALPLPRWVRAFLRDMLTRAEYAAQCLVLVSARLQAGDRGVAVQNAPVSFLPLLSVQPVEDVPSTQILLCRMRALRRLLETLPRHGRRLLRSARPKKVAGPSAFWRHPKRGFAAMVAVPQWIAPEVERPPDRVRSVVVTLRSRSVRTGDICVGCS